MKKYSPIFLIFIFSLVFYLPILKNPNIFINRGNDLTEFFWPLMYYVKNSITTFHQIPFWNNLFFSGTPLLPDPQNPSFYLPNIVFLFMNLNTAFLFSLVAHSILGGVGMYFASKSFGMSKKANTFASILFISSPKLMAYVEAGHYGLITSWAWLPLIVLALNKIRKVNTTPWWIIILSISFTAIFFSHIITFAISITGSLIFLLFATERKHFVKTFSIFFIALLLTSIVISPILIPQLKWQSQTTRELLLANPDVYPKWTSKIEFISALFTPSNDTEKIITFLALPVFFAAYGLFTVRKRYILLTAVVFISLSLIALNNASPIQNILLSQSWYVLFRVSTRFWFSAILIVLILAARGYDFLLKRQQSIFSIFAILAILESIFWSYTIILRPINKSAMAPQEIYEFLSKDKDLFRVFCLDRCLSQQKSAQYGLELADGYGTLQQKNYYIYSQQLAQAFWRNRYTLSIPPYEIYHYEKFQPYSPALTDYRIKYVISDHYLKDTKLKLVKTVNQYLVYENTLYINPNYLVYTPNFIRVPITNINKDLVIPEVYNNNWHAYLNGKTEVKVDETQAATRLVKISTNTKFVDFIYEPWRLN